MINISKLRGLMAEQGVTQKQLASQLGISANTLSSKMKKGVFGSDELDKMIQYLSIENPADIFFAKE